MAENTWEMIDGEPCIINNPIKPSDFKFPKNRFCWRVTPNLNNGNPYNGWMLIAHVNDNFSALINCNKIFLGIGGRYS